MDGLPSRRGELFDPTIRVWWKVAIVVYFAIAFALLIYWAVTGTGLYRVIDELFTSDRGDYRVHYPKTALVFSFLLLAAPFMMIRLALGRRVRISDPNDVRGF